MKSAEGVRSTQNAVNLSGKRMEERVMFTQINNFITWLDGVVWGLPLIILILFTGILLTTRLGLLQVRHLGKALKFMVKNEEGGDGEVTSFGALCTALSATIGTGNIVGVATAIAAGGPGALFWMIVAAFFGMATKYAEGLLAIKYRTIDKEGHVRQPHKPGCEADCAEDDQEDEADEDIVDRWFLEHAFSFLEEKPIPQVGV